MKRSYKKYTDTLKMQAVTMHMDQNISLHEIARELSISDASVIRKWVRAWECYGDDWLKERRGRPRTRALPTSSGTVLTLPLAEQRISRLEQEVALLREHVYGLISTAE